MMKKLTTGNTYRRALALLALATVVSCSDAQDTAPLDGSVDPDGGGSAASGGGGSGGSSGTSGNTGGSGGDGDGDGDGDTGGSGGDGDGDGDGGTLVDGGPFIIPDELKLC